MLCSSQECQGSGVLFDRVLAVFRIPYVLMHSRRVLQDVRYRTNVSLSRIFELVPADFETRIRELCDRALGTVDPEQLHAVFDELRAALREHSELVRDLSRTCLASIEHKARD